MVFSRTKTDVPFTVLKSRLTATLGEPPAGIVELDGGMFNSAFRVVMGGGEQLVVRVGPTPDAPLLRYERDLLSTEIDMMRLVRDNTSIPVPRIVHVSRSGDEISGAAWFAMEVVPGRPLDEVRHGLSEKARDSIDRDVGRILVELNSITGQVFGYPNRVETQHPQWRQAFERILADLLDDGADKDVPLPLRSQDIRILAEGDSWALSEVTEPRLVHWDLWDGNVFVDDGEITGIIDFERALWGDPLMEYNFSSLRKQPGTFYAGYGRRMPQTEGETARRRLYDLHFFLVHVIETYYREYEPNDQLEWAYPILTRFLEEYPR